MANMHEIKNRMKSIKETRQITRAMKLVSAAKLKKARKQLEQTLPYFDKVKQTIADIIVHSTNIESPFFDFRHEKRSRKKGLIVFCADKGLAGGYNNNIVRLAEDKLKSFPDTVLFVAGYMGRRYFEQNGYNVHQDFDYPVHDPTVRRAYYMSDLIIKLFKEEELDEVHLAYTFMHSSINLEPRCTKLLPLDPDELLSELGMHKDTGRETDYSIIYEPSPESVLDVLVQKYVKGLLYGALVEAFTSEQSARMTAMDNATSNADEMLYELNLLYNRARQAGITQEISEIVGGAAVLGKQQ
jgi:F-type H+-transporting ATPase subunit gamma